MRIITRVRRTPAAPSATSGFTLLELIVVMVILGALAVVGVPRLYDAGAFRQAAFRDEVVAALRYAQKTAVSHRRLVCASFAPDIAQATALTLTIGAANGAATCSATTLNAPDGSAAYARSLDAAHASASVSNTTDGRIYFQPSGIISTSGAAGTAPSNFTIAVSGMSGITLVGSTGLIYAD